MKFKLLTIIIAMQLASVGTLHAQDKVKKFCELLFRNAAFSGKYNSSITLDYGQTKKYTPLNDSTFVGKLMKVEAFETLVGALNYMTELGWKYEGSSPLVYESSTSGIRVLFSREFDRSELKGGK